MIFGRNIQNFTRFKSHTENKANFDSVSSKRGNFEPLRPLSKKDKILIKSLQECNGYNAWQFITKFLNKGWTKNRLLVKFGTVDRRDASGQR